MCLPLHQPNKPMQFNSWEFTTYQRLLFIFISISSELYSTDDSLEFECYWVIAIETKLNESIELINRHRLWGEREREGEKTINLFLLFAHTILCQFQFQLECDTLICEHWASMLANYKHIEHTHTQTHTVCISTRKLIFTHFMWMRKLYVYGNKINKTSTHKQIQTMRIMFEWTLSKMRWPDQYRLIKITNYICRRCCCWCRCCCLQCMWVLWPFRAQKCLLFVKGN